MTETCPSSRTTLDPTGDHLLVRWTCQGCKRQHLIDPRFRVGRCGACGGQVTP